MESKTSQELLSMSAGELLLWCQDLQVDRDELESQLAALQSRADQDRADAERYRWVKAQPQSWMLQYMRKSRPLGPTLDAAIDAARATQKESEKQNG